MMSFKLPEIEEDTKPKKICIFSIEYMHIFQDTNMHISLIGNSHIFRGRYAYLFLRIWVLVIFKGFGQNRYIFHAIYG